LRVGLRRQEDCIPSHFGLFGSSTVLHLHINRLQIECGEISRLRNLHVEDFEECIIQVDLSNVLRLVGLAEQR